VAILYLGVCLPDVLFKALLYLGHAQSWLCEPTHSPLGLLPFCYVGALLFEEAWRKRAFAALLAGSWLHLLFDLGKNYLGSGVICWAFPFSMRRVERRNYNSGDRSLHAARARGDGVVELLFAPEARYPAAPLRACRLGAGRPSC
jgi:hypothetical protein